MAEIDLKIIIKALLLTLTVVNLWDCSKFDKDLSATARAAFISFETKLVDTGASEYFTAYSKNYDKELADKGRQLDLISLKIDQVRTEALYWTKLNRYCSKGLFNRNTQ